MNVEFFLAIYVILIIIAIILEVYLLANDKYRYVRVSINLYQQYYKEIKI